MAPTQPLAIILISSAMGACLPRTQLPSMTLDAEGMETQAPHLANEHIDVQSYRFQLILEELAARTFHAEAELAVKLNRDSTFIDLHMESSTVSITEVLVGGVSSGFEVLAGPPGAFGLSGSFLRVDLGALVSLGTLVPIAIHYDIHIGTAPGKGMDFQADFYGQPILTTRNWPYYLRYWLPSNDHPSDTATFEIDITVNKDYRAASNGRLIVGDYENGAEVDAELHKFVWSQQDPIPTYGVNLTVGKLDVVSDQICFNDDLLASPALVGCEASDHQIPFAYYIPQGHPRRSEYLLRSQAGKLAIAYFSQVLGLYPYDKVGLVVAPHPFNMESVTMVVMVSPSATVHEMIHHWWGNTVYISHWGDFWISEGFTTYFTGFFDEVSTGVNSSCSQTTGRLDNPSATDPMTIFDRVAYCKGAAAIADLRARLATLFDVNDENTERGVFLDLMRQIYQSHRFQTLGSQELVDLLPGWIASTAGRTGTSLSPGETGRSIEEWASEWFHRAP